MRKYKIKYKIKQNKIKFIVHNSDKNNSNQISKNFNKNIQNVI